MRTLCEWHQDYDQALRAYKRKLRALRLELGEIVQHRSPQDPQLDLWDDSRALDKPVVTV